MDNERMGKIALEVLKSVIFLGSDDGIVVGRDGLAFSSDCLNVALEESTVSREDQQIFLRIILDEHLTLLDVGSDDDDDGQSAGDEEDDDLSDEDPEDSEPDDADKPKSTASDASAVSEEDAPTTVEELLGAGASESAADGEQTAESTGTAVAEVTEGSMETGEQHSDTDPAPAAISAEDAFQVLPEEAVVVAPTPGELDEATAEGASAEDAFKVLPEEAPVVEGTPVQPQGENPT